MNTSCFNDANNGSIFRFYRAERCSNKDLEEARPHSTADGVTARPRARGARARSHGGVPGAPAVDARQVPWVAWRQEKNWLRKMGQSLRSKVTFALAALTFMAAGTHAESVDDSLRVYAVNIVRHPPQEWTGYGIYLGNGLVITAAHVVGSAWLTRPTVRIAGLELPTQTIKEGSLDDVDLTLLSIDESKLPVSLQMRRLSLCKRPPFVGEPVVVTIPESAAPSQIVSPLVIPQDLRARFSTAIKDVATTGNSGSGVFDAAARCLLGIMSRKFFERDAAGNEHDIAKYFVPAATIAKFIPPKYHF
jgi:hypothetical protein